jgi:hypothetical protein
MKIVTMPAYDPVYVERFHRVLIHADHVFKTFRASFLGKSSPVHFFWVRSTSPSPVFRVAVLLFLPAPMRLRARVILTK